MIEDRFVGFYISTAIWAGNKPDLTSENLTATKFTELMSEEVFLYNHKDYKLRFCKDGLFIFQTTELKKELDELAKEDNHTYQYDKKLWNKYLNYLNCIYLLFESSIIHEISTHFLELSELTQQEVLILHIEDGKEVCEYSNSFSVSANFHSGRYLSNYSNLNDIESDSRIWFRKEIPKKVFDRLNSDFEKVFQNYEHVKLLAQISKSLSEYKIGNYATSLVLSWFIIETYLMERWESLLENKNETYSDGKKRINKDRFDNLSKYNIA